ncbi:uncharacterized protein NP_7048A (plasmid) [Natronomonas pharaonis DSM 2160]|uniref:Uncharacterized protein n=1 Tax=Natronomonas pharaonis (strain ATCC 35678 / DSM 2160 / CIP 103997 / JCM 8858 / NBRC 14720 / NCIMB 2260 / Gabara) TaxID=348780 RepID=Q3ILT0_NATPD|nr:hypothetical protein [Natronomonas pharaonis]CAI49753.1 uncharacterized protein NP_3324A [Natronomonas pharaonis DSM 2160]CAI50940.1 uncharacterized protein NP_7048A [Natronomonas pharaonis DSM 2160]
MFETVVPKLRKWVRLLAFFGGLAAVGFGIYSILVEPLFLVPGPAEPTRGIEAELLLIVGGFMWCLLVTKI